MKLGKYGDKVNIKYEYENEGQYLIVNSILDVVKKLRSQSA